MKHLIKFPLAVLLLSGCIVIKTSGYKSGYHSLTEADKGRVVMLEPGHKISDFSPSDTLYQISAAQVNDFLKHKDSVLIYYWSPHCPGETCYPIHAIQQYCNTKGYILLVICDYIDFEVLERQRLTDLQWPLLVVNAEHYGSDICWKYQKRFRADLFDREIDELSFQQLYSRYQLFSRGDLIKGINDPLKTKVAATN